MSRSTTAPPRPDDQRLPSSILPANTLTLGIVLLGFLALPMSMSGAGVALRPISIGLDASGSVVQWVITGYFLTASSFMLVAGSLGDALGRRRIYRVGVLLYTMGSLTAALAPTIEILLATRVIGGLGAAGVMAGGSAILASTFTGAARTRAFAAVGTVAGIGLAFGPTLAGWIIQALGWRLSFGVFAIAGAVLLAGAGRLSESRAATRSRIDVRGAVSLVVGIVLLMLAISQGSERGANDRLIIVSAFLGMVALAAFVAIERRVANPVLDLRLLRNRRFMGWLLAAATVTLGFGGLLGYLPSYLQGAAQLSSADVGLIMLMPTLPMLVLPALGGRLLNRGVPATALIAASLLIIAAGNGWLMTIHPEIRAMGLLGPLVTVGIGVGTANGIIESQAMNQIEPRHTGMAAGILNTIRSGTNAVTLAVFGAALIVLLGIFLDTPSLAGRVATGNFSHSQPGLSEALTETWRTALGAISLLCALSALTVVGLVKTPRAHEQSPASSNESPS